MGTLSPNLCPRDSEETVTGEVKLKLYKGNIINAGVTSPYSLYSEEIATFGEDEVFLPDPQGPRRWRRPARSAS